jgi:glutaminyl-tRNA synthetase
LECDVVTAGVVVSIEDIHSTVAEVLKENMEAILEQRYHINGWLQIQF